MTQSAAEPLAGPEDDRQSEPEPTGFRDFASGTWAALPRLFSRKWWFATVLVILGMAFLVRLGLWQLDRLDQRRTFNRMVIERWTQPPWDLEEQGLPTDLKELEYRRVEAIGELDYANQIVVTNQPGPTGEAGVQLVTPLVFENGKAVLVARGWVPQDLAAPDNWSSLQEPEGSSVVGLIQQSQTIEGAPSSKPKREWYRIDVPLIQQQMPYELLPAFVLQLPEEGRSYDQLPYRIEPIQLDEGSHLSYSIQWFSFALILAFGYIQFVRLQDARAVRVARQQADQAINSTNGPDSDSSFNS